MEQRNADSYSKLKIIYSLILKRNSKITVMKLKQKSETQSFVHKPEAFTFIGTEHNKKNQREREKNAMRTQYSFAYNYFFLRTAEPDKGRARRREGACKIHIHAK